MTTSRLRLLVVALLSAMLSVALVAPAEARPQQDRYPDRIELPVGFQPEGITIGRAPIAYLGSRTDGDIVAADLKTGQVRLVSEGLGAGFPSIGLKVDKRGLLYVAGGTAGTGRVISARTGKILANYDFTDATNTFVNDVVLTDRYAWFTDSRQAQLYQVERTRTGRNADAADVRTVPLSGEWEQVQLPDSGPMTNNANGIAQTPDRRALLVVNSATGKLFRVNPRTGAATEVDLGGYALTNGDGLLVQGSHAVRGPEPAQPGRGHRAEPAWHRRASFSGSCAAPTSPCPPRWRRTRAASTCPTPGSASSRR